MTCPSPHLWSTVLRADGSTWLVMRCDLCGLMLSCDPKHVPARGVVEAIKRGGLGPTTDHYVNGDDLRPENFTS